MAMQGSLTAIAHSMSELERCVTNMEGHTAPSEDDEQEDNDPLESDEWGRPSSNTDPEMGREPRVDLPRGRLTPSQ